MLFKMMLMMLWSIMLLRTIDAIADIQQPLCESVNAVGSVSAGDAGDGGGACAARRPAVACAVAAELGTGCAAIGSAGRAEVISHR